MLGVTWEQKSAGDYLERGARFGLDAVVFQVTA